MMNKGQELIARAEERGLKLVDIARVMKIDSIKVSKVKSGVRQAKVDEIDALREYLQSDFTNRLGRAMRVVAASGDPTLAHVLPDNALPATVPALAEIHAWERDIPILGTAQGADVEMCTNGHLEKVEQTIVEQASVIGFAKRPPALAGRKAYALYIVGTSMEPRYMAGELVFVDPSRPPQIGDHVVVQLAPEKIDGDSADQHAVTSVLVKRLVKRTADVLRLEQYNPGIEFSVKRDQVAHLHRIIPWSEVVGA